MVIKKNSPLKTHSQIKAIIFDFDGTILDTERTELTAWEHIYAEHDCVLPLDQWQHNVGTLDIHFNPLKHLETTLNRKLDYDEIKKRRRKKLLELVTILEPLPGVIDWLETAKNRGLKLALASSSHLDWITSHLTRIELLDYFESIVTRDAVKNVKPDPEIYHLTLKNLNLNPHETIAIEDSPNGAKAAVAAGINCLIVPNTITAPLTFPETFCTVRSLSQTTLDEVLQLI